MRRIGWITIVCVLTLRPLFLYGQGPFSFERCVIPEVKSEGRETFGDVMRRFYAAYRMGAGTNDIPLFFLAGETNGLLSVQGGPFRIDRGEAGSALQLICDLWNLRYTVCSHAVVFFRDPPFEGPVECKAFYVSEAVVRTLGLSDAPITNGQHIADGCFKKYGIDFPEGSVCYARYLPDQKRLNVCHLGFGIEWVGFLIDRLEQGVPIEDVPAAFAIQTAPVGYVYRGERWERCVASFTRALGKRAERREKHEAQEGEMKNVKEAVNTFLLAPPL